MNSIFSKLRFIAVLLSSMLLGACVSTGVSFEQFRQMEDKSQYLTEIKEKVADKALYDSAQKNLLYAGLPVTFEYENVKMTKVWDKSMRKLSFYDGHVTSTFGSESLLLVSILTEVDSPTPWLQVNRQSGKMEYTIVAANVSVQETMARVIAKGAIPIAASAFNGVLAAQIVADSNCKGDCGGGINISTGDVVAASTARSASDVKAQVAVGAGGGNGCKTCMPLD